MIFVEKTFAFADSSLVPSKDAHSLISLLQIAKASKVVKVFSLETFPLYGIFYSFLAQQHCFRV